MIPTEFSSKSELRLAIGASQNCVLVGKAFGKVRRFSGPSQFKK